MLDLQSIFKVLLGQTPYSTSTFLFYLYTHL
jgi:hypothetical protein